MVCEHSGQQRSLYLHSSGTGSLLPVQVERQQLGRVRGIRAEQVIAQGALLTNQLREGARYVSRANTTLSDKIVLDTLCVHAAVCFATPSPALRQVCMSYIKRARQAPAAVHSGLLLQRNNREGTAKAPARPGCRAPSGRSRPARPLARAPAEQPPTPSPGPAASPRRARTGRGGGGRRGRHGPRRDRAGLQTMHLRVINFWYIQTTGVSWVGAPSEAG